MNLKLHFLKTITGLFISLLSMAVLAQNRNAPPKKKMIKIHADVIYSVSMTIDTSCSNCFLGDTYTSHATMIRSGQLSLAGEWEYLEDNAVNIIYIKYHYDPENPAVLNYTSGHGEIKATGGFDEKSYLTSETKLNGILDAGEHRTDITRCHNPGMIDIDIQIVQPNNKLGNTNIFSINVVFKGKTTMSGDQYAYSSGWGPIDDGTPSDAVASIGASNTGEESSKALKITPTPTGYILNGSYTETSSSGMIEKTTYTITIGEPLPKDVEVKNLETLHPHCVITDSTDKVVELTAVAKKGTGQIQIDSFEIKMGSKPCLILKNQGGTSPFLILKGCAKTTEQITIVALYKKAGKQERSEPFELNWCYIEKPELVKDKWNYELKDKKNYLYDGTDKKLEITAYTKHWLNGKEEDKELKWEIKPNDNGLFKNVTITQGKREKFEATQLPEKNDDFGNKYIKAKYIDNDCECESDTTGVTLFYSVAVNKNDDAKNNPEGKYPNWFYYWKQTPAWIEIYAWKYYDDNLPPPLSGGATSVGEVARFERDIDQIIISRWACNRTYGTVAEGGWRFGLDCFATGIRHENYHRTELNAWWGKHMVNHSIFKDCDLDMVPNSVEESLKGCRTGCPGGPLPFNKFSCDDRPKNLADTSEVSDLEINAYRVGWQQWKVGQGDKYDWGCPGKQCPGNIY